MALKKEVSIKVKGNYISGSIVGYTFKTGSLINNIGDKKEFTTETLKKIIEELQELVDTMEGVHISHKLSSDNNHNNDIESFSFNL